MATALHKGMLVCAGVALIGGGLAGMGLANYTRTGAFDFYKQRPPATYDMTATADSAGYYPVSRAAPMPLYPENPAPPPAMPVPRSPEPVDYRPAALIDPEPISAEEPVALSEPVSAIPTRKGSWAEPEDEAPVTPEAEPAPEDPIS